MPENRTPRAKAEAWEDDEVIITVEGFGLIGATLSRSAAATVVHWLNDRGGLHALIAAARAATPTEGDDHATD